MDEKEASNIIVTKAESAHELEQLLTFLEGKLPAVCGVSFAHSIFIGIIIVQLFIAALSISLKGIQHYQVGSPLRKSRLQSAICKQMR